MKSGGIFVFIIMMLMSTNLYAADGIIFGMGMTYIPIAKLDYVNNPNAGYEVFDNIMWGPEIKYNFGNGFEVGASSDFYNKRIEPNDFTRSDLSLWGLGLDGSYGYALTESGTTLLVGGAEMGYGEITDKANSTSKSAGSIWVAGLAGVRFDLFHNVPIEFDYRLGWLQFDVLRYPERKYKFSGNSLKLSLGYEFGLGKGDKGDISE